MIFVLVVTQGGGEIVCLGSTRINKTFECCCQFARGVRLVALIAFLMV